MTIGLLGGRVGCVIPAAKHENMTIMNIEWPCVILVTLSSWNSLVPSKVPSLGSCTTNLSFGGEDTTLADLQLW